MMRAPAVNPAEPAVRPTDPDAKHPPANDADLDEPTRLLRAKLNQETARIPWAELQRFFARGVAVWIDPGLDLVDTAVAFSQDRTALVQAEMAAGRIARVDAGQALEWSSRDANLWAVVVSPWVLVQEDRPPAAAVGPPRFH
jgi:hypothetical protein